MAGKGDEKMSIGENLRRIREEKKITQVQLASRINVTQSMLCQIERGTKTLSLPLAKDIAAILDCSLADLINDA